MIGTTLGHYRIVEKIGTGGMGVVYRAHDERLDRDVAIKVLPEEVAGVQDRLERFEREAKLLASLNHPNIATLHGLEEEEGRLKYLVMELVEGESLASVIARGPIPFNDAMPIALQIAQALETAHEHGIIHRDLKPANVMVNSEGQVKVLDFGLAKAFEPDGSGPQSAESIAESPTLTADLTRGGVLLGTAAYMSPEQARGKSVDKRADIWAFGCVFYEMLTGSRAFAGTTSTEALAAIIKDHPDWNALPVEAPTAVRSLLRRCLTKDPRDRLHDIADGRIELQSSSSNNDLVDATTTAPQTDRRWRFWLVLTLAAAAGIAVGNSLRYWWPEKSVDLKSPIRFEFVPPKDQKLDNFGSHNLALSPDGTRLVYSANRRLYLRSMDDFESSAILGSEGFDHLPPQSLFFSPDGEHVGFWADGRLRKIHIAGGAPVALCDTLKPWGAHWGANEQILFGRGTSGIWSVDANGGPPKQVISVDAEKGEFALGPQMLADGDHVLFTIITGREMKNSKIVVHSLKTGRRHLLVAGGADGLYVSTGHILYVQRGTLFAAEFDTENFELSGRPVPVLNGLLQPGIVAIGSGQYSVSRTGTLAYKTRSTESNQSHLAWVGRNGEVTPILDHTKNFGYLSLSPNGDRVAATISNGVNREIWVFDLSGSTPPFPIRRGGCSWDPVWTPDGQKIIFSYAETTNTTEDLYWVSADGNDIEPGLIHAQDGQQYAYSISADGGELFFTDYGKGEKRDVWVLDLTDASNFRPLLDSEFDELHATVSPNERWLAYTSNRTGREEIWVASYPDLQRRRPVSIEGGREPRWSQDGSELFYRDADKMMAVVVTTDSTEFHTESPRVLFEGKFWGYPAWPTYGVAPDGRFLMIQRTDLSTWGADPQRLHIIVNWFEELERLIPTE